MGRRKREEDLKLDLFYIPAAHHPSMSGDVVDWREWGLREELQSKKRIKVGEALGNTSRFKVFSILSVGSDPTDLKFLKQRPVRESEIFRE